MNIQAEVSFYPLQTDSPNELINRFIENLNQTGVRIEPGTMSTIVSGENDEVFRVLSRCFAQAAENDAVVLVAKFSNACPSQVG